MQSDRLCAGIDAFSVATGRAASWLTVLMVLMTFVIVVLRYVFGIGSIWLQESVIWMHAAVFMLGVAYTLQQDGHVRVDIFYRDMSEKRQAFVNLVGVLIFVFPVCAFLAMEALDYVGASWSDHEVSRNSGGLPYPSLPLIKSTLLLMPATVALQGVSILLRSVTTLRAR